MNIKRDPFDFARRALTAADMRTVFRFLNLADECDLSPKKLYSRLQSDGLTGCEPVTHDWEGWVRRTLTALTRGDTAANTMVANLSTARLMTTLALVVRMSPATLVALPDDEGLGVFRDSRPR